MKWLDQLFDWLFLDQTTDPLCIYCKGLGYDASGYACTCVEDKE